MRTIVLDSDCSMQFSENFFSPLDADRLLKSIKLKAQWRHEPIKMFGRLVMQPRLSAWYGDSNAHYSYSGIALTPLPWFDELVEIKDKLEGYLKASFNSVLLNDYRNQHDSMGWHRDNEKELGPEPLIASVSLGAARDFYVRRYSDKADLVKLPLTNGSLLVMSGKMQQNWEHSLPKRQKAIGERINLTYRLIRS